MLNHPGDIHTLQRIAERRRIESTRRAERRRLTRSDARTTRLRIAAASTLRDVADRLAPGPPEAHAAGCC